MSAPSSSLPLLVSHYVHKYRCALAYAGRGCVASRRLVPLPAMKPMTGRQIFVLTVFITTTTALIVLNATGGDLWTTALTVPLVASTAFWSMRLSQRIALHYGPRYAAREAEQRQATAPTSERPDHARRRREQRRPRGRRRPE